MWPSLESETSAVKMVTFTPLLPLIGVHFRFHFACWHLKKSKPPSCLPSFIPFLIRFVQYRARNPDNNR